MIGIQRSYMLEDLMFLAGRFITYDVIDFRIFKDLTLVENMVSKNRNRFPLRFFLPP
jgi:hypothetical protein